MHRIVVERLVEDKTVNIRIKASEFTATLAAHAIGRAALLHVDAVDALQKVLADEDRAVRLNAQETLRAMVSGSPSDTPTIFNSKPSLIADIVCRIRDETDNTVRTRALGTLYYCAKESAREALEHNAVPICVNLLDATVTDAQVLEAAAKALVVLSDSMQGKKVRSYQREQEKEKKTSSERERETQQG